MDGDGKMKDICGPHCQYCVETDPGGLKEAIWMDIMMEFSRNALSTLFSCDGRSEGEQDGDQQAREGQTKFKMKVMGKKGTEDEHGVEEIHH